MQTFNKRKAIASFLVANRGVALYEPVTNTHLNAAGGAIVLADGQIGVFAESGQLMNKSLIAADTSVKANEIALYQGTSASANPSQPQYPSPLFTRPYEKTQTINSRFPITVTKQPYTVGSLSTYTIKNITAVPFSNYALNIAFRGRNAQVIGSSQEAIAINPQFNTPAYTAGQLATPAPVSEIVNNMVVATLRNSSAINQGITRQGNYPVLALAIDTTAAATGVVISTLTAGTVLPIMSDIYGTKNIILNAEQAASIIAACTASG